MSFSPTSRALSSHSFLATTSSRPSGATSFSAQSLRTKDILPVSIQANRNIDTQLAAGSSCLITNKTNKEENVHYKVSQLVMSDANAG